MTEPNLHSFFAAKGGQGTTVVAASVAVAHAQAGDRVLLVDAADHHDLHAVLGAPDPTEPAITTTVADRLDIRVLESIDQLDGLDLDGYDVVIVDAGHRRPNLGRVTLVTRCCYLALRRALAAGAADDVVVVAEPGRALTSADVASVLGLSVVATIRYEPAVARTIDAGLLASRLPAAIAEWRQELTATPTS